MWINVSARQLHEQHWFQVKLLAKFEDVARESVWWSSFEKKSNFRLAMAQILTDVGYTVDNNIEGDW